MCKRPAGFSSAKTLQKVIEPLQTFVWSTECLLASTNLHVWKYKHLVILKLNVFFHSPAKAIIFLFSMEIKHLISINIHFQRIHCELVFLHKLKKDGLAQSPLKPSIAFLLVSVLCLKSKTITYLSIYSSLLSVYASFWYLFCQNEMDWGKSSKSF